MKPSDIRGRVPDSELRDRVFEYGLGQKCS